MTAPVAVVEEIFVCIKWHERFAVSNYGRVIDLLDESWVMPWKTDQLTGRVKVHIPVWGAYVEPYLDELVTEAFFVNFEPDIPIFYKNRNKQDCTVLNLTFDPKYKDEDE
jgi:hypothetical protein